MPVAKRRSFPDPASNGSTIKARDDGRFVGTAFWAVDKIVDENATHYLLKWEGTDRKTGEPWEHTWEPKENQTDSAALIEQWEEDKRANPNVIGVEGAALALRKAEKEKKKNPKARLSAAAQTAGPPAERKGRADKRKRDSTVSSDVVLPAAKRKGKGGSRQGSNQVDTPLPNKAVSTRESDLSSLSPPDDSSPDRPKRAAHPSAKVRENQELDGHEPPDPTSKADSAAKTPANTKANGTISKTGSPSRLGKTPSVKKVTVDDTPVITEPPPRPATPPPSASAGASISRSSLRGSASASPVSKKASTAAKPVPLAPAIASPTRAKGKARSVEQEEEVKDQEAEKNEATSSAVNGAKPSDQSTAKQDHAAPAAPPAQAPSVASPFRRPNAKTAEPAAKKKTLAPVPQPDPDVFRPYLKDPKSGSTASTTTNGVTRSNPKLDDVATAAEKRRGRRSSPPARPPHSTQSTTASRPSQNDPIAQFSSPTHSPAPPAARRVPGPAPSSPSAKALAPPAPITPGRKQALTEEKVIGGVKVTVLVRDESESSSDDDSDATTSDDGLPSMQGQIVNDGEVPSSAADIEVVERSLEGSMALPQDAPPESAQESEILHGVTLKVVKVEPAESAAQTLNETPEAAAAAVEEPSADVDVVMEEPPTTAEVDTPAAGNVQETNEISVDEVVPATQPTPVKELAVAETLPSPQDAPQDLPHDPSQDSANRGRSRDRTITVLKTTESIFIEEVVSPRPASAIPPVIVHRMGSPKRAASRTSSVRSRNPSPSNTSESPTKEASPTLMQSILDEVAVVTEDRDRLRHRLDAEIENQQIFREQLDKAHVVITDLRSSHKDDQRQIALLKEQLHNGLKQQRIFAESIQKNRDEEVQRLRAQVHILLEQSRLTDDSVRLRASKYHALRDEHGHCAHRFVELEERVQELRERNMDLSEQIALLRAVKMGVVGDDSSDAESDESSALSSAYSPHKRRGHRDQHAMRDKDALSPGDKVVRCLFATVGDGCDLVFTDEEAHMRHIQEHKARLGKDPYPVTIPPASQ